jgi:DNA (cytosine-5)-methyltransferase 1
MGKKRVKAISLFSGCGGTDWALSELKYDIVFANDICKEAADTYNANIPGADLRCGDISEIDKFPAADLLVGCYPCQGFTQGGRRDWGESINFLYRQFDRVLRKIKPKAFIVENVNGMAYGANAELLQNQLTRYRSAGYRVAWKVLNAQDYGVAQHRKRVFLVGVRSDSDFSYYFPDPTHGEGTNLPFMSQREALKGLPKWPRGEFNDETLHWYYMSRNRRRDWNQPSACVVGHWRHVPLHPSSPELERVGPDEWRFTTDGPARRLAYKECAALQGFPSGFKFHHGTVRDKFQMIGNAVPPPLFKAVAKQLDSLW